MKKIIKKRIKLEQIMNKNHRRTTASTHRLGLTESPDDVEAAVNYAQMRFIDDLAWLQILPILLRSSIPDETRQASEKD